MVLFFHPHVQMHSGQVKPSYSGCSCTQKILWAFLLLPGSNKLCLMAGLAVLFATCPSSLTAFNMTVEHNFPSIFWTIVTKYCFCFVCFAPLRTTSLSLYLSNPLTGTMRLTNTACEVSGSNSTVASALVSTYKTSAALCFLSLSLWPTSVNYFFFVNIPFNECSRWVKKQKPSNLISICRKDSWKQNLDGEPDSWRTEPASRCCKNSHF